MLTLVSYLQRAHVNSSFEHSPMDKFEILFPHIHNLSAKHIHSLFSVRARNLQYMCCLSGSVGSSRHMHLSPLHLRAESDPRVNISMAFLGQQLHYWAPAWWTRPLLLRRERESEWAWSEEGRWKDERSEGCRISRMMKWGEGMRECEWRMLAWKRKEERSDQINHQLTDNWTNLHSRDCCSTMKSDTVICN